MKTEIMGHALADVGWRLIVRTGQKWTAIDLGARPWALLAQTAGEIDPVAIH